MRMQKKKIKKKKEKKQILTIDDSVIYVKGLAWGKPEKDEVKKGRNITLEINDSHIT